MVIWGSGLLLLALLGTASLHAADAQAAAGALAAPAPSPAASRWNVVPLTFDCDTELDGILEEYYTGVNATQQPVKAGFECDQDCRDGCGTFLKPLFMGQYDKLCPPEERIRYCLQVAEDDWSGFAADCEYFSSIGGTKPTYTAAQLAAGQGGAKQGSGCFPAFVQPSDFQNWLAGNFTSPKVAPDPPPPSLGPVTAGFHYNTVGVDDDCDEALDGILDTFYYSTPPATLPQEGKTPCDAACRSKCGGTIDSVFNGTSSANGTCPAEGTLQSCLAVARTEWVWFVRRCEPLGQGIPPRGYKDTGNVVGSEASEGRRRLLSTDELYSSGEEEWGADYPVQHHRHLSQAYEGEGEHEGHRPLLSAYSSLRGAESIILSARRRVLLAEALEGAANVNPLPIYTTQGPTLAPINPLAPATSAFSRAQAASPLASAPQSGAGAATGANQPSTAPGPAGAEGRAEAAAPGSKGGEGESEALPTSSDPRQDGCFPDFHTWGDFDAWLQGTLVIAPRPPPDHGKPNPIGLVSVIAFVGGMIGLAWF